MLIQNEITNLIKHNIKCVDCHQALTSSGCSLECNKCLRVYEADGSGVWNFVISKNDKKKLEFYNEINYQKWQKVFVERELYDWAIYKTPLRRFFSQAGHRIIKKNIKNDVLPNDTLLEIGAGNGALLKDMQKCNYIGIDNSSLSLAELKKQFPWAIVICTSGIDLPFENETFDNIVSLHTLEHIYSLAEHIAEVKRILKVEGYYSYVIPTEGGLGFWLGRQMITGPHLKNTYDLDVNKIMERDHINNARRVLKFLDFYFPNVSKKYWPLKVHILSLNAMIYGKCQKINF